MHCRRYLLPTLVGALLLLLAAPSVAAAQMATPTAPAGLAVVAHGLTNPRGFTWGADGTLYVALAGTGAVTVPATPAQVATIAGSNASPAASAAGKPTVTGVGQTSVGTLTASVVKIVGGCAVPVATGLASTGLPDLGWIFGAAAVAFLDGQLYVIVAGGGPSQGLPNYPDGVYRIAADGTATLVADLSAWFRAHPVAHPWPPITPEGEPYAMLARDGALWITESNQEQLLRVTPDGTVSRVADFSPLGDSVPTGLAAAPGGGLYVGFLSPLPFTDGTAKVLKVSAAGQMTDVWTGLTAVTAVAVGPDGTLYASELATGNSAQAPFYHPNTGKVVRQTGPGTAAEVATGLNYPAALAFGPDGALYVGSPALGAVPGAGIIARLSAVPGTPSIKSTASSCTAETAAA